MARSRKSHEPGEEKAKASRSRLEPPYSSRVDGHRYVIYCSYPREGEDVARVLILKFLSTYAAQYFVKKVIGNDDYDWDSWMERDDMVVTSRGIRIRADKSQMKEILDYEPTAEEAEWTDDQLNRSVSFFKYGRDDSTVTHRPADDGPADAEPEASTKPQRQKADPKPKKARADTSGMVTANELATELKVEGRIIRGILRSLKMEKPEHGWAWSKDEVPAIRKKLEAGLKDLKKKKGK